MVELVMMKNSNIAGFQNTNMECVMTMTLENIESAENDNMLNNRFTYEPPKDEFTEDELHKRHVEVERELHKVLGRMMNLQLDIVTLDEKKRKKVGRYPDSKFYKGSRDAKIKRFNEIEETFFQEVWSRFHDEIWFQWWGSHFCIDSDSLGEESSGVDYRRELKSNRKFIWSLLGYEEKPDDSDGIEGKLMPSLYGVENRIPGGWMEREVTPEMEAESDSRKLSPENYKEFSLEIENDKNLSDGDKAMILDDAIESLEEQILRGEAV